jgi:hypothetical protein
MRAALDDAPFIQDDDFVGMLQRADAVCDNNRRFVRSRLPKIVNNSTFAP